jgi:hypothetical protein
MGTFPTASIEDEPKGLRRFETGAIFGLAGGVAGLALPITINLLSFYDPVGLFTFGTTLVELTTLFVFAGALLLAVSLICYRFGFGALRKFDRRFLGASILCNIGTIGLVILLVPMALALYSTPTMVQCIRGAPSHALSCLGTIQPLFAYAVTVGFWLAWLGGLGIVVGLELGGRRYREARLFGGGAAYALLLLVLIAPFVALLFPIGGWQYPLLTVPLLALLAPALVYSGSHQLLGPRIAQ